jgi:hypothetical protein
LLARNFENGVRSKFESARNLQNGVRSKFESARIGRSARQFLVSALSNLDLTPF